MTCEAAHLLRPTIDRFEVVDGEVHVIEVRARRSVVAVSAWIVDREDDAPAGKVVASLRNPHARLVEQRGIDEQCIATPHPGVERTEFLAAKGVEARQGDHEQVAARRRVELAQRGVTLAPGAHAHAGALQPLEQGRMTIAAPLAGGGTRLVAAIE